MSEKRKTLRCAIYTRKSTDHNLDLEFNSLDAQREACEAYIKSQAHEGWTLVPDHYDDGGISGASLERPAVKQLLEDIEAGKVDIVVVYKVDRLTRSLADFAKLVELFDAHEVSFVSITQSFNTTSSMGRLTLNVLLSFAQFEREVIGERVRDKIAASKKKGIWVGGPIPLGYASVNKKLVVIPEEAEAVRDIFRRYLRVGSIRDLAGELERDGIVTKRRTLSTGRIVGGGPFSVGALASLLQRRFYIGEVVYKGETSTGDHDPILDRDLFDAVQKRIEEQSHARALKHKAEKALLTGKLFDEEGRPLTPTHTSKKGVRYRYYVSHAALQRRQHGDAKTFRLPAGELEEAVTGAIKRHLSEVVGVVDSNSHHELVERWVERVVVGEDRLEIQLSEKVEEMASINEAVSATDADRADLRRLEVPWCKCTGPSEKGARNSPEEESIKQVAARDALLTAIAKARLWVDELANCHVSSVAEIAEREGKVERHIRLLIPLAFVSPQVVQTLCSLNYVEHTVVTVAAKQVGDFWHSESQLKRQASLAMCSL